MWNRTPNFNPQDSIRDRLTQAFKLLRKQGFIALQNHMCCGGCAGNAIANRVETYTPEKLAKVKGAVFYHAQDAEVLTYKNQVYLAFGHLDTVKCGIVGLPTLEVGKIVKQTILDVGLGVVSD